MDHTVQDNAVFLCGSPAGEPVYSHAARSLAFYTFPLLVRRLSGAEDRINVTLRAEQLDLVRGAERLCVAGEVRTFNSRRAEWPRLIVTVFARSLCPTDAEDDNRVFLRGTLCKQPKLRTTPMGREICDLILAVNRHYGRSDYLPCICWGLTARQAARWEVGTRLALDGRLQSRCYRKLTDTGYEERTAYEISASGIEPIDEP